MSVVWKRFVPLVAILFLAGCAAQRYQAAPIHPDDTALKYQLRSLAAPGLQTFEEKNLGHAITSWPPETWDLQTLTLAALYFNPALDAARARVGLTEAVIVTAGQRPNPTLGISPGIPSPYLLTLDFAIPIETKGKRGDRIQFARNLDQAARFDLADSAWAVRSAVRGALLNDLFAARSLELLRAEEKKRTDQVNILEKILFAGEIQRTEMDPARIELSKSQLAVIAGEGQTGAATSALAAAVGIPAAGLEGARFSWPGLETLPDIESLSPATITREAVLNRLDVRRSLAQYAAAESNLQLEIAKQYPDINIGPGYTYEETHSFFTLGASSTLPLFNRNQGPIAEAKARRQEAAALFLETQAQVVARSEHALATYRSALKELAAAESLRKLQDTQLQSIQASIRAGADTRLALDAAEIQSLILARSQVDALARAQRALGELEDALQRPLDPKNSFSIDPELTKPDRVANAPGR
jgi:outer membrane protein, heavy metal efflux system